MQKQGTVEAGFERPRPPSLAANGNSPCPRTPGMNRLLYHLAIHGCCGCLSRHSFKFVRGVSPRYPGFQPDAPQLELTNLQGTAVCVFLLKTPRRAHDERRSRADRCLISRPSKPGRRFLRLEQDAVSKNRSAFSRLRVRAYPTRDQKCCCGHLFKARSLLS